MRDTRRRRLGFAVRDRRAWRLLGGLLVLCCGGVMAQPDVPLGPAGQPLVTNVFFETELRQALADVAVQTKTVIIVDDAVQGWVTLDLKNVPLDRALDLLLLQGGYIVERIGDDVLLVTTPDVSSPNFARIAKTEVVELSYILGDEVQALLPDVFTQYIKSTEPATRVVITAPTALGRTIAAAVRALDQPPVQVMIEVLVVESTASDLEAFKIDLQTKRLGLNTETGLATYVDDAAAVLHQVMWLVTQNKGEIKATPRVVTQNGRKANVRVALQQYFSLVAGRLGFEYVTLQAIESGVGLTITPQVSVADKMVTCLIEPEVGDVTGTTGAAALPIITKRTALTTVRVADGQIIAIGGLLQTLEREIRSKVPILGDIPLLGELFRSKRDMKEQREVTIFLVPHILDANGSYQGPAVLPEK